jgi:hypothetical protein
MQEVKERATWNCKARLLKYKEDIDVFAKRNTLCARTLRKFADTVPFFGRTVGRWIYDKTVGRLERKFYALYDPYQVIEMENNCLLNSGIDEMWDLITGVVSGATHIFDNAAATIGVGDSATAAAATQTDLQAATNKTYKGMESGYPTSTTQKVTLKSSFGSGDANYAWQEWVVKQGTSTICLNRKVESLGTKSSGTWTLETTITLS